MLEKTKTKKTLTEVLRSPDLDIPLESTEPDNRRHRHNMHSFRYQYSPEILGHLVSTRPDQSVPECLRYK